MGNVTFLDITIFTLPIHLPEFQSGTHRWKIILSGKNDFGDYHYVDFGCIRLCKLQAEELPAR